MLKNYNIGPRIKAKMERDRNANTVVLSFSVPEKNRKKKTGSKAAKSGGQAAPPPPKARTKEPS
jgi:hypothetical protein